MNILKLLEDKRVFSIEFDNTNTARIIEECDRYFDVYVTKQQLLELAKEIEILALKMK